MSIYGYGKILDINLSTGDIVQKDIEADFARNFIGGMGFSGKLLFQEVKPETDPLSDDNILIFANGPFTGTHVPCSGRTEITTKSPLTGSIGTGNTGGMWGAFLKHAGFDVLVIRGKAKNPVYLWIHDNNVKIKEAAHLWGKETAVIENILKEELGGSSSKRLSVLSIGPAGENLVRYACPVNDYYHVAGRCGAGAVMGAKKLKAIAVSGNGTVAIARPEEFTNAVKEARARLLEASNAKKLPGAPIDTRVLDYRRGSLPAKNYQTGFLPDWEETRTHKVAQQYITGKEGTCFACPISCFDLAEVKSGKYAGTKAGRGSMPGVVFSWGANCAIDNLPAIYKCKELCHQYGLDTESACSCIAFAMELYQREILTSSDVDGLELHWGNETAVITLLKKIAYREGIGHILAEGSKRAASLIGKGAEQYALTIKGMELSMVPDPRAGMRGWLFGSLVNPRGADNVKNTHFHAEKYNPNWWTDKFDIFNDVKQKIYCVPPEETPNTWQGKPLMCKWFEDMYSIVNAMGLCFFPVGFQLAWGPTYLSRLYSACTGHDITPQEVVYYGEKVFTTLKAYNIRQGLTRKDDSWPDRFFNESLPEGPSKGAILSREIIENLLDEYYELRGWDKTTGIPNTKKLVELGLDDIASELERLGKIVR
ncbi:aldehyde ferredoxin oxidoreductase family protein [Chloroflexota bacterium]